jgi:CRP-like cAMP-binding protein
MPFQAIAAGSRASSLRTAESYAFPAGATILMAGDPAVAVFSIREGFIKLWRRDDAGRCRIVRLMRPGDMLGLEATFQDEYQLSAATLSPAKLCRIPVELLTRLENDDPVVHHEVERRWHGQLKQADDLAAAVLTGPSRERVLKLLRFMAEFAAPDPCPRIRRLDMAALLDISSETAARVIADLKHAGLLEESPNELHFEPARLRLDDAAD